ncbi:antitoxin VbhA family protein [Luteipulveratus sp. YIM 133132]|uniref:antitoxin VbhA family protein n=1 Tax=Luteipulveratus flavus TaxID=3031728 RepID=UPI0023B0DA17|nr:antitoxin VbhA family protein [Luteipulveratus sp. YIM 133132]MDE9363980.1 antitoxin VbhA family protein [Luteipulveratus sp. YIM 133132]
MTPPANLTPEEEDRRLEDIERARHSTAMEGGTTPPETRADQDAYARGEIDEDEMVRRFRARYDLD